MKYEKFLFGACLIGLFFMTIVLPALTDNDMVYAYGLGVSLTSMSAIIFYKSEKKEG